MTAYADRVYRLAYGVTRNAADAQEIVQDVFSSDRALPYPVTGGLNIGFEMMMQAMHGDMMPGGMMGMMQGDMMKDGMKGMKKKQ